MFKEEIRGKTYFCLSEKEMKDIETLVKLTESLQKGD